MLLLRVALSFSILPLVALAASPDPVINLSYSSLRGNASLPGVHFFGGIPYVQAPVGDLRFRAPVRLDERARLNPTLIDARNWGPICVQQPAVIGVGYEGTSQALVFLRSMGLTV